jgi:hypothetical protein
VDEKANDTVAWDGILTTGAVVPNGQYRLGIRALKILAEDLDNEDSWETFVSPLFTINRTSESN